MLQAAILVSDPELLVQVLGTVGQISDWHARIVNTYIELTLLLLGLGLSDEVSVAAAAWVSTLSFVEPDEGRLDRKFSLASRLSFSSRLNRSAGNYIPLWLNLKAHIQRESVLLALCLDQSTIMIVPLCLCLHTHPYIHSHISYTYIIMHHTYSLYHYISYYQDY
jgi:hypothetical protein